MSFHQLVPVPKAQAFYVCIECVEQVYNAATEEIAAGVHLEHEGAKKAKRDAPKTKTYTQMCLDGSCEWKKVTKWGKWRLEAVSKKGMPKVTDPIWSVYWDNGTSPKAIRLTREMAIEWVKSFKEHRGKERHG